MATTVDTVKPSDETRDLRAQIEVALLNRIAASVAQATAAELRDLLYLYRELCDWYGKS